MKLVRNIIALALLSVGMGACDKDFDEVTFDVNKAKAPVLTVSSSQDLVLEKPKAEYASLQFQWTDPGYEFSNGVNTQAVNYTLQIDVNENFSSSNIVELGFKSEINKAFTVKELNSRLILFELPTEVLNAYKFRVKSSLGQFNAGVLYSNVLTLNIITYLDVSVPLPETGELWAIGACFAGGWDNSKENNILVNDQKFTKVSATKFELEINFLDQSQLKEEDKGYKVIQEIGVWGTQYHALKLGVASGGGFELKDSDPTFGAQAEAGRYRITLDFVLGKYTVVKI